MKSKPVMKSQGWVAGECWCSTCDHSWIDEILKFNVEESTFIYCPRCRNMTGILSRKATNEDDTTGS